MGTKLYIGDDLISDDDGLKAEIIGSAGEALDTLGELADALNNSPNQVNAIIGDLATKAPLESPNLTGLVGINKTAESGRELDIDGNFRLLISPSKRVGGQPPALIKSTDQTGTNLRVEGPVTVTHDLFKNSGVNNGFADNSNHFHNITKINRIKQQGTGEVKNIERVQEKYYAVQTNAIKNSQAAFWNWHRVTRNINSTAVDLNDSSPAPLVGWDVSAIQDFSGRAEDEQVMFSQSENTTFTFTSGNNPFTLHDLLQIKIDIEFAGAIVAATHFAKVTGISGDEATVVLYGGNYKSTDEVPDGNSQTALTTNFSVSKIDTSAYMLLAGQSDSPPTCVIDVLDGTGISATRANTKDTFKLTFAAAHNLELNDNITVITDGSGTFQEAESAFVIKVDSTTAATFVYGRAFEPESTFQI